ALAGQRAEMQGTANTFLAGAQLVMGVYSISVIGRQVASGFRLTISRPSNISFRPPIQRFAIAGGGNHYEFVVPITWQGSFAVSHSMTSVSQMSAHQIGQLTHAIQMAASGGGMPPQIPNELRPQHLMEELAQSGVRHNPDDVIMVVRTPDGKLLWLETGNSNAGLKHIVDRHASDLASKGIPERDIPKFMQQMLQTSPIRTGAGGSGPFADFQIGNDIFRVAYGTNGFIVSFYPIG
ncbi:MAG: hypothetical protein FWC91_08750, partial [Defluviitaleaceae bacterium]|nr:hypothetical protein [Defluviitaleaceae bacterium]